MKKLYVGQTVHYFTSGEDGLVEQAAIITAIHGEKANLFVPFLGGILRDVKQAVSNGCWFPIIGDPEPEVPNTEPPAEPEKVQVPEKPADKPVDPKPDVKEEKSK